MLLRLLIVFTLYSSISTLNSLVDLPLKVPKGSSVINATLTDVSGSKKYFIQELISASSLTTKGKILISSDTDFYSIHYNADSHTGVDSKERLVIQGTNCLLFTYKNSWDKTLSGIKKTLLNQILLMGPSILYRFDHSSFIWKSVADENIRGIMMKGASTEVNENLKITFYYRSRLDFQSGMKSPSRIEFSGYDPTTIPYPGKDSILYADIYSIQNVANHFKDEIKDDQVQNEVQPPSGIGCPHYSSHSWTPKLPGLRVYHMHYIMEERIKGSTTSRSLSEKHRFGLPVEAWESVEYNVNINGKKVDKAVITQYFALSQDEDIFWGYSLVCTKVSIYDYDISKKVYTWTDEITRDYMNFQEVRSVENIQSLTGKAKFASTDEKVILNFILECEASDEYTACIKPTKDRVYSFKGDFLYYVLLAKPVSLLRISDIQYRFTDTKVEMEVTFIDLPHLEYIFNSKYISVSEDTFDKMIKTKANNEGECLEKLSQYKETIKVAIYRSSDAVCGYLSNPDDLKEDTKQGQSCSVYFFPLNNLNRVKQELTLDQIHDAYLQVVGLKFYVVTADEDIFFKINDVIDKTKKETSLKNGVTSQIRVQAKLKIDDQFTLSVPDTKTFADCYRNCHESDQVACVTFSFCNNDGKIDCRVSSLQASEMASPSESIENDPKCGIYSISVLENYSRKSNRRFITQLSTAVEKDFVDSCAESCHSSSECISFQYCDGYCSFGDLLYTDAATEYDEECMIYTRKVSERYQRTGNKMVSDVMLTETKLTLDQCASLCYELSDGDETGCKSFNYCPKSRTESSCSLAHFSVKSPYIKTTDGGHCSNYELKESNGRNEKSPVHLK